MAQLLPKTRPNPFKLAFSASMAIDSFLSFQTKMTPGGETYLFLGVNVDVDVATSPLVSGNGANRLAN